VYATPKNVNVNGSVVPILQSADEHDVNATPPVVASIHGCVAGVVAVRV
jgi:hypothetical protein